MQYIYIGDLVNTHGLKGEVRILSDFEYKDLVFKEYMTLYVGKNYEKLIINSYRKHKMYDMVTFKNITDINDVIGYKGDKVYINREDIKIDGFFKEDIIGLNAYVKDTFKGVITYILKSKAHDILVIENNNKKIFVPYLREFIEKIDLDNKEIYFIDMKGLFDEN